MTNNSLSPSLLKLRYQYRLAKTRQTHNVQEVYTGIDPVTFLETEMYITDTGLPLILHPEQKAVIREMFRRDKHGFVYNLMLYSSIKKSAKTTIAAGILLWQGFRVPHGEIYIIGNDLRQADSRMAQAVRECITLNPRMKGIKLPTSTYRITLPNGTRIETIPVDPSGESGMNPSGIFITEAWGAKSRAHELLWTEARLSPTRQGESFKFVESYAGHTGQSLILERLYENIVKQGTPLPDVAPELYSSDSMIAYWNTRAYLPWQTPEYYASEEKDMLPGEFRRVHRNEWTTSDDAVFRDFSHALYIPDVNEPDEKHIYTAGIDWGQADDYSCLRIIDVTDNREVYCERWRHIRWDDIRHQMIDAMKRWHVSLVLPEANSASTNVEALSDEIYAAKLDITISAQVMTNKLKSMLIATLRTGLDEDGLKILDIPYATQELRSFQSSITASNMYTFSAPPGQHDDTVIALCLAYYGAINRITR